MIRGLSLAALAVALLACGASPAPAGSGGHGGQPGHGGHGGADTGLEPHAPTPTATFVRARAEKGELLSFSRSGLDAAADGTLSLSSSAPEGTDPYPKGGYQAGKSFYNGGAFRVGTARSPELSFPAGVDSITPSFDIDAPPGTWAEVLIAVCVNGSWSKDYNLGIWARDGGTVERHSVDGQGDATGDVATDTLELTGKADSFVLTVRLFSADPSATPRLRTVAAVARDRAAPYGADQPDKSVWGTILDVPKRSQMIYPNGGEVWCSPTSSSMLAAYWSNVLSRPALTEAVPDFQQGVYDWVYDGAGNWPFNTAHAAALDGGALLGVVTRLPAFSDVEALIQAQIPVAISVGVQDTNGHTLGHLIVVRGFDANGDVVVNDPAYPSDAEVEATLDRKNLEVAWRHSDHTAYVLWPASQDAPVLPSGALY